MLLSAIVVVVLLGKHCDKVVIAFYNNNIGYCRNADIM